MPLKNDLVFLNIRIRLLCEYFKMSKLLYIFAKFERRVVMKRLFSTLIFTFLACSAMFAASDKNLVFLCFGQSNMEGNAKAESVDAWSGRRFQKMYAANSDGSKMGTWDIANPPLARQGTGLTPVDYFGRYLVDSLARTYQVRVIVVAVAGCSMKLFDKSTYASYLENDAADWLQNIAKEYDGNPYQRLIDLAKKAQRTGVISGILIHQGETDAYSNEWLNRVKKIYNDILTDLELNAADVPLLAGEVVHADQNGACSGANSTIDRLPSWISTAHVISSKGCPAGPDKLHFTAEGYRMLGRRYGAKMFELLKAKGIPSKTSVNDIIAQPEKAGSIFDMNGRPQTAPFEGLQIIDGHKVYYAY